MDGLIGSITPDVLASLLSQRGKERQWSEPLPIPEGARRDYARLSRLTDEWNHARSLYKLADARLDAAKAALIVAMNREAPETRSKDVKWDANNGTYQVERDDEERAPPPSWVAEMITQINEEIAAGGDGE